MPNPSSSHAQDNWYWSDGSGFQFDLSPKNVSGGFDSKEMGGIYNVPNLAWTTYNPTLTGWTNWVDKYQIDYRFGATSDKNANCQLFPEVDDPWMFTEYVYEGTGKESAEGSANAVATRHVGTDGTLFKAP